LARTKNFCHSGAGTGVPEAPDWVLVERKRPYAGYSFYCRARAAREIGYPEYIHKFNLMFSCRDARMPFCQDLERPIGTLCRAPESIEYVKRCSQKRLKNFAILISVQGARRI